MMMYTLANLHYDPLNCIFGLLPESDWFAFALACTHTHIVFARAVAQISAQMLTTVFNVESLIDNRRLISAILAIRLQSAPKKCNSFAMRGYYYYTNVLKMAINYGYINVAREINVIVPNRLWSKGTMVEYMRYVGEHTGEKCFICRRQRALIKLCPDYRPSLDAIVTHGFVPLEYSHIRRISWYEIDKYMSIAIENGNTTAAEMLSEYAKMLRAKSAQSEEALDAATSPIAFITDTVIGVLVDTYRAAGDPYDVSEVAHKTTSPCAIL